MKKLFTLLLILMTIGITAQKTQAEQKQYQDYLETINQANDLIKNKSFKEMITPYVKDLLESLDKGVDFIIKETPEVIQQYLMFEAVKLWIMIGMGFILCVFSTAVFVKQQYNDDWTPGQWFILILGNMCGIALMVTHLFNAVKVTWFPKLYLLEKFINLI